jgi:cytochrome c biogenesis protein CcmG, thiol:disulfide interchange protein DsbE
MSVRDERRDQPDAAPKVGGWAIWVPLVIFLALIALMLSRLLSPAQTAVDSKLVGQPLPEFSLPPAQAGRPGLDSKVFRNGKPHLLNIFASWCIPCRVEAPQLARLKAMGVPIEAISVRDTPENLEAFLGEYGDPFQRIGADDDGKVQLALGSSGVPETYVIDGDGVIRYQHIGEIRADQLPLILQKLEEAGQ